MGRWIDNTGRESGFGEINVKYWLIVGPAKHNAEDLMDADLKA
jgi:hypothetical protein